MATFVSIDTPPGHDAAVDRALGWFHELEACCSRFDEKSEIVGLTHRVGIGVRVSPAVFEAIRFALAVAEDTGGAFDPTIGASMEARGFDREHRTRARVANAPRWREDATYRDVEVDGERQTITLRRPLLLDLGAVAKGLAIDWPHVSWPRVHGSLSMPAAISSSAARARTANRGASASATRDGRSDCWQQFV